MPVSFPPNLNIGNYQASTNLLHNNTTEQTQTDVVAYQKEKETVMAYSGRFRVTWEMKRESQTGNTAYGKIYVNDVAVGTERTTVSLTYVEVTAEDFQLKAGDLLQLYVHGAGASVPVVSVQNLKIKGTQMTDCVDQDP